MKRHNQNGLFFVLLISGLLLAETDRNNEGRADQSEQQRSWELRLGMGTLFQPVYQGSDKCRISPLPYFNGHYSKNNFKLFLSFDDGLGIRFDDPETGFFLLGGINRGNQRDPGHSKVASFLSQSPKIVNRAKLFGGLGVETPIGAIKFESEYYRARAEYDESISEDRTFNGIIYNIEYSFERFIIKRFYIKSAAYLRIMNEMYAEVYHGVTFATPNLERFDADMGLQSVGIEVQSFVLLTKNIGAGIYCTVNHLLSDAQKSPLTIRPVQPQIGVMVLHRF